MLRNRWHEALSPDVVRVVGQGGVVWTPLEQVAAGDLVEIASGEYLPVDGTLEAGAGEADTAFLTGEDRPRVFAPGDFLFAGYRYLGRSGATAPAVLHLRVVNPHQRTRAASLRQSLESLVARKRTRNLRRERIALGFTLAVAASALCALWIHRSAGWEAALISAAAVFIVSCSCALALAVPISRGIGLLRAHRLGFHFRDQETLERLAEIRAVLFDKTGTLTFTQRSLESWMWAPSFSSEANVRERLLDAIGRLTGMSVHPVAKAVHVALARQNPSGRITSFSEIPHFGLRGIWVDGVGTAGPELSIPLSAPSLPTVPIVPTGDSFSMTLCRFGAWEKNPSTFQELALEAPRPEDLIALESQQDLHATRDSLNSFPSTASTCLFVDGKLAALITLGEDVKPGASDLLRGLEARGMAVSLLSGDQRNRVMDFATRSGFKSWRGGLSPEEKQIEAREFQLRHGAALAVGDGYNDSLLFGEAAVSLAVQGAAGPVATEADAFMTSADPASILSLLRIADGTRKSLRNCYLVSGVYNAGAISLAVAGVVTPLMAAILMPIASLSLCLTAWLSIPRK